MKYGELNLGQIEALVNKLGGMDGVASLLAGEMVVTRKEIKVTPPEPEAVLDPIIRVDRSVRPSYPDWMKEVMHPELESVGPAEYGISAIEQWLYEGQKNGGCVVGNKIYDHLKKTDTLKTCLGLRDLEEIQKKGIAFFRKHFKGKAVFGWSGIVRDRHGDLSVPYLYEYDGWVVLRWPWAGHGWSDNGPALRFASSTKA